MNNVFRMAWSASLALVIGCAPNFQNAGGSSQQGNGVVMGKVLDMLGHPAAKAVVSLYPAEYDPVRDSALPKSSIDTTDSSGRYELSVPDSAMNYNILASAVGAAGLMQGVMMHGDTTPVADLKMTSPGDVFVTLPDNADRINGYVYMPGTGAYARLSSSLGVVELKSVPAGIISRISYCAGDNSQPQVIRYSVPVQSGAGVTVFNPGWRFARLLHLNTTASGANVTSDVENFPALVRLTSANFDFSQAQANGADIRFTKTDNAFLPYEIERWDSAAGQAEIWVRVDTVRGNNDNQSITMYWGSASAADSSNGATVFDTAIGFQGVWHLAEAGNATAFDATINHYNGTPAGMTSASAIAGIIGQAQQFNGASGSITMSNTAGGKLDFPENGTYSISLWVCADTIDTLWHAIAGKGHEQYYIQYKCFGKNKATWEFVEFHDQKGWEYCEDSTPPAPGPKQWLYLVGVRSGTSQWLYVNGELAVDTAALMPGSYARNTGDNFSIGRYERPVSIPYYQGWSYFNGKVDEVRVSRGTPTADWIKLCYMNQKSDDALVVFDQY